MSIIIFDEEMDRRIEFNRFMENKKNTHTKDHFCHYIFMLGLIYYEDKILSKQLGEHYEAYSYILDKIICKK